MTSPTPTITAPMLEAPDADRQADRARGDDDHQQINIHARRGSARVDGSPDATPGVASGGRAGQRATRSRRYRRIGSIGPDSIQSRRSRAKARTSPGGGVEGLLGIEAHEAVAASRHGAKSYHRLSLKRSRVWLPD